MEAESAGRRFALLGWALDERLRRLFSATEAKELGRGGVTAVAAATGVSRRAIHVGLKELAPPSTSRAMRSTANGTTRSVRGRRIRDLYLSTSTTNGIDLARFARRLSRQRWQAKATLWTLGKRARLAVEASCWARTPWIDALLRDSRERTMRTGFVERYGKLTELDRSFDVGFWQDQPAQARFDATWELIVHANKVKGGDVRQLRLQRSVEAFQHQPG